MAFVRIELLHVLMRILPKLRVLLKYISLLLVLGSTFGCHHFGSRNLHVSDDELVGEERVLLILTLEIGYWNEHILNLFKNLILLVNSTIYDHLIFFIAYKLFFLKTGQFEHISRRIFTDTCGVHLICLSFVISNSFVTFSAVSK